MISTTPASAPRFVGRYAIYDPIATGGMATVHLGRLVGPVGFARTVAVKRLHPQFARDPDFVSMFLDEARVVARIQHPNVVPTIDVIAADGELLLVMEYVRGEALGKLLGAATRLGDRTPPRIAVAIMVNALAGLHAAHEATDESGNVLGIVHRDVSPQNILVGIDGVARVLDFGVAKAEDRVQITREGQLKGKLLYMSPEQLEGGEVDRRTDIYAMGVVLFETLTGARMFVGEREAAQLLKITRGEVRVPSQVVPELGVFDAIVRKATAKEPKDRYATAREMARALEALMAPASPHDVGEWVDAVAGVTILERTRRVAEIESAGRIDVADMRKSLVSEMARTSSPDLSQAAAEASGISSKRLPEVPSEGSSSGVLQPQPQAPAKSSARIVIAGLALLLVSGLGLALGLALRHASPDAAPPPSGVAATPVTPPTATAIATADTAAPPPATAPDVLPSASAAAAVSHAGVRHRAGAPSAAASAAKPDCEQPYQVDSAGHMHFRRECL